MKRFFDFRPIVMAMGIVVAIPFTGSASGMHGSSVEIAIREYGFFRVELNGRHTFYTGSGNAIAIHDVVPGMYDVRIIRMGHAMGPHHQRPRVVYDGIMEVPARADVQASYDRFGLRVNVMERRRPPIPRNAPTVCAPPAVGMAQPQFERLMRNLDDASFDNTRMSIAKAAIQHQPMSSYQIAEVMKRFSFDSNRLSFAKYAYAYCADPENYYTLSNQFDFESNARALMSYIQ